MKDVSVINLFSLQFFSRKKNHFDFVQINFSLIPFQNVQLLPLFVQVDHLSFAENQSNAYAFLQTVPITQRVALVTVTCKLYIVEKEQKKDQFIQRLVEGQQLLSPDWPISYTDQSPLLVAQSAKLLLCHQVHPALTTTITLYK